MVAGGYLGTLSGMAMLTVSFVAFGPAGVRNYFRHTMENVVSRSPPLTPPVPLEPPLMVSNNELITASQAAEMLNDCTFFGREDPDEHFMEPLGREEVEQLKALPTDPFLPPFELLLLKEENKDQIFAGDWIVFG